MDHAGRDRTVRFIPLAPGEDFANSRSERGGVVLGFVQLYRNGTVQYSKVGWDGMERWSGGNGIVTAWVGLKGDTIRWFGRGGTGRVSGWSCGLDGL